MKNKVSPELTNKIKAQLEITDDQPYSQLYKGKLFFNDDEEHLFKECEEWREMINTYFRTSTKGGSALKIGRFIAVKPVCLYWTFPRRVDFGFMTYGDPSWEDWFMIGEDDAPKLFT